MRIRLLAILVMISAGSLILASFNAADEPGSNSKFNEFDDSVSVRNLKPEQWYAVRIQNGIAEFQRPARFKGGNLQIVVTAIQGAEQESTVTIRQSVTGKSSSQRYSPIDLVKSHREMKPATGGNQLKEVVPIFVSDDEAQASRREFKIPLMSSDGNLGKKITLRTTPLMRTEHVEVFVEDFNRDEQSAIDLAVEIAESLEERVLPILNHKIGIPLDVDGSGRLSVVLSPKVPGFTKGKHRVKGFVLPDDLLPAVEPTRQTDSNNADVIFLDSCLPRGEALVALLAHEYTHVASLSNAKRNHLPVPAMWVNEAVAHVGERFCSKDNSNIRDRLTAFLQGTNTTPLLLDQTGLEHLHRNPAIRGASFSFVDWCVRFQGDELIRELTYRPGETVAVLEEQSGLSFDQLVQHWGLSLAESRRPAFLEISTQSKPMTATITGSGNLFLEQSRTNWQHVRLSLPPERHTRVAFRWLNNH